MGEGEDQIHLPGRCIHQGGHPDAKSGPLEPAGKAEGVGDLPHGIGAGDEEDADAPLLQVLGKAPRVEGRADQGVILPPVEIGADAEHPEPPLQQDGERRRPGRPGMRQREPSDHKQGSLGSLHLPRQRLELLGGEACRLGDLLHRQLRNRFENPGGQGLPCALATQEPGEKRRLASRSQGEALVGVGAGEGECGLQVNPVKPGVFPRSRDPGGKADGAHERFEDVGPERDEKIGLVDAIMGDVRNPQQLPIGAAQSGVGEELEFREALHLALFAEQVDDVAQGAGGAPCQVEVATPLGDASLEGLIDDGERLVPADLAKGSVLASPQGGLNPLGMVQAPEPRLPAHAQPTPADRMLGNPLKLHRFHFAQTHLHPAPGGAFGAGRRHPARLPRDNPVLGGNKHRNQRLLPLLRAAGREHRGAGEGSEGMKKTSTVHKKIRLEAPGKRHEKNPPSPLQKILTPSHPLPGIYKRIQNSKLLFRYDTSRSPSAPGESDGSLRTIPSPGDELALPARSWLHRHGMRRTRVLRAGGSCAESG